MVFSGLRETFISVQADRKKAFSVFLCIWRRSGLKYLKCTSAIPVEWPLERTALSLSVSLSSIFPPTDVPWSDLMARQILEPLSALPEQRPLSVWTLSLLLFPSWHTKCPRNGWRYKKSFPLLESNLWWFLKVPCKSGQGRQARPLNLLNRFVRPLQSVFILRSHRPAESPLKLQSNSSSASSSLSAQRFPNDHTGTFERYETCFKVENFAFSLWRYLILHDCTLYRSSVLFLFGPIWC